MNPTYSSPRSHNNAYPNNIHPPFYNPQQKESLTGHMTSPQNKIPPQFGYVAGQTNSKSYLVKNNFEHPKPPTNNSAYLKSVTETANSSGGFQGFSSNFNKTSGEMTKSSFHDHTKVLEAPTTFPRTAERLPVGSPTRRQPRYSEPGNMQSPLESVQDTKSSFIPFTSKGFERQKQQKQIHFYKKHPLNNMQTSKEDEKKEWLRKSPLNTFMPPQLAKNKSSLCLDNFQVIKNVGNGKYGKVFLAKQKLSGFMCALKVIEKAVLIEEEIIEQFIREVKIQMFLYHPNIIKMYGCFDDKQHIYVVLEVGMGGQLYEQLKRTEPMPEVKVASLMKQICSAVEVLHNSKIIHRDIKPENIVMHENICKLCDFGWSVHLDNKMRTTFCGTPLYVCPQILKGNEYDEKIDIWSIGIMMYEMLVGQNPFKITTEEELIKIVKDEISIPSYVFVSKEARDFLDKCLKKNPNDRVTIKQLVNHPFFSKNAEKEKAEKKMVF